MFFFFSMDLLPLSIEEKKVSQSLAAIACASHHVDFRHAEIAHHFAAGYDQVWPDQVWPNPSLARPLWALVGL